MCAIAIEVFGFIDGYLSSLTDEKRLLTDLPEDEGLVLFCREFFNQFFASEFDITIEGVTSTDASDAWVEVQPQLEEKDEREAIAAAYRQFCQDYETIIGDRYDKENKRTGAFQTQFVPELLTKIADWSKGSAVERAAGIALDELKKALKRVKASDHGKSRKPKVRRNSPRSRQGRL